LLNIGVLISGSGSNLQSLIDSVNNGYINGRVSVVISDREGAYGIERAKLSGIPSVVLNRKAMGIDELNDRIMSTLKKYNVELIVLAGYLSIISSEIVQKYKNAIINIHPSLIPSFCGPSFYGLKVHEKAIEYGVKVSGCTVHFVDEGTDTGPIILQKAVEVYDDDTPEILQKRILVYEHKLLPEAVKLFCEGRINISGRKVMINRGN
jgi:phosphoribosylglycinamide formyltransferase, formyltetrahydrofolate-dependent